MRLSVVGDRVQITCGNIKHIQMKKVVDTQDFDKKMREGREIF